MSEIERFSIHVSENIVEVRGWITTSECKDIIDMFALRGYVYATACEYPSCVLRLTRTWNEEDEE